MRTAGVEPGCGARKLPRVPKQPDLCQAGDVTEAQVIMQGRAIGWGEVQQVRQLLAEHPDWSRWRLSRELAALWDWRNGAGQLKDMRSEERRGGTEGRA